MLVAELDVLVVSVNEELVVDVEVCKQGRNKQTEVNRFHHIHVLIRIKDHHDFSRWLADSCTPLHPQNPSKPLPGWCCSL